MCLYAIGLKDPAELDRMVQAFADGTEIEVKESDATYRYGDFLGRSFKVIHAADLYAYDEEVGMWVNHESDAKYVADVVRSGEDLTIVGVVQPKADNSYPVLSMGVGYPSSLVEQLMADAAESPLVQAQLADPEVNVLTGKAFGEEKQSGDIDLGSLFSVDPDALAKAFSFDPGAINLSALNFPNIDLSDIDLSNLTADDISLENIVEQASKASISREELVQIFSGVTEGFKAYAAANGSEEGLNPALLGEYLQTEEGAAALRNAANALVERTNLNNILKDDVRTTLNLDILHECRSKYLSSPRCRNENNLTCLNRTWTMNLTARNYEKSWLQSAVCIVNEINELTIECLQVLNNLTSDVILGFFKRNSNFIELFNLLKDI